MNPARLLPASKRLLSHINNKKGSVIKTTESIVWGNSQMNKMLDSDVELKNYIEEEYDRQKKWPRINCF